MRYHEIIQESDLDSESFASRILDILTPLAAQGVEYVTIPQVLQKLKSIPSGLYVDREMVMSILDPNKFPLVKSIEGDKLYLQRMAGPDRAITDDQADKEADKISSTATKQAIKNVTK